MSALEIILAVVVMALISRVARKVLKIVALVCVIGLFLALTRF